MKKNFLLIALLFATITASAQVGVPEPEFINSYCILTSDSTMDVLPKETGSIGNHKTKAKSILNGLGKVANVATAVGGLGFVVGANAGNISGAMTGLKVMSTASSVDNVASSVNALAGAAGMDIIFNGKESTYTYKNTNSDVRLLIKGEDNENDPMGIYRIVRFNIVGKERRIQWMEFDSSFLSSDNAKKAGFVNFTGHKYGNQSYLLTIPAAEIENGEYGVFYMNIVTASVIPVGTFSVK